MSWGIGFLHIKDWTIFPWIASCGDGNIFTWFFLEIIYGYFDDDFDDENYV